LAHRRAREGDGANTDERNQCDEQRVLEKILALAVTNPLAETNE
jgi:hypothetical protein